MRTSKNTAPVSIICQHGYLRNVRLNLLIDLLINSATTSARLADVVAELLNKSIHFVSGKDYSNWLTAVVYQSRL